MSPEVAPSNIFLPRELKGCSSRRKTELRRHHWKFEDQKQLEFAGQCTLKEKNGTERRIIQRETIKRLPSRLLVNILCMGLRQATQG